MKEDLKDLERKRDLSVFQQIDFFINLYSNAHTIIIRFLETVQIYYLNCQVHIGIGSSVATGVSIGAAYGVTGIIENLIRKYTVLHKAPTFNITPDFTGTSLESTWKIRFSFSIRKTFLTAIKFLLAYRKTRHEFKITHPFESTI